MNLSLFYLDPAKTSEGRNNDTMKEETRVILSTGIQVEQGNGEREK